MKGRKLKGCATGGPFEDETDINGNPLTQPMVNPFGHGVANPAYKEGERLIQNEQPFMTNVANPLEYNPTPAKPNKKAMFSGIHSFLKDNEAQVLTMGLGFLGNVTDRDKNDRRQMMVNGSSDSLYSTNAGSRGNWTENEGYLKPDQKVISQFTANPFDPYGIPRAADGMSIPNLGAGLLPGMTENTVPTFTLPQVGFKNPVSAKVIQDDTERYDEAPNVESHAKFNNLSGISEIIAARESGGNYLALPKRKDGTLVSSAVGKYQFLWKKHKDWIGSVTGETTKEGFMHNPEAQEKAFGYWNQNTLTPAAQRIQKELGVKLPLDVIKTKVHFAGAQGAYDYFAFGKETKDGFGTKTSNYIKFAEGGDIPGRFSPFGDDTASATVGGTGTGWKDPQSIYSWNDNGQGKHSATWEGSGAKSDYDKKFDTMVEFYKNNNPLNNNYHDASSHYSILPVAPALSDKKTFAKKGGPVKYEEGGEYEMSASELKQFLKDGGQVQYI